MCFGVAGYSAVKPTDDRGYADGRRSQTIAEPTVAIHFVQRKCQMFTRVVLARKSKQTTWWTFEQLLRRCYTKQSLLQLVSQFCCDTSCALRYTLLESCYTRQRFSVIVEAVVSSAAILSWNKISRAQKKAI